MDIEGTIKSIYKSKQKKEGAKFDHTMKKEIKPF